VFVKNPFIPGSNSETPGARAVYVMQVQGICPFVFPRKPGKGVNNTKFVPVVVMMVVLSRFGIAFFTGNKQDREKQGRKEQQKGFTIHSIQEINGERKRCCTGHPWF